MNRQITSTEIESMIKNFSTNKSSEPDSFTGEFSQIFREELAFILWNSSKTHKGRKTPQHILSGHPHPFNKSDKDITHKKENYRPISLMNRDAKIVNKY